MLDLKAIKVKKGFTLIEIIVTMVILFMTLAIVSPLLNYNLKSLYTTENRNDLQREAYGALENFTKKAMEAQKIEEISMNANDPSATSLINVSAEQAGIKYIKFVRDDGINYIFQLDSNKVLKEITTGITVANDVSDIVIQPLPIDINDSTGKTSTKKFGECGGVKITFKFSKNLVDSYTVASEVKFRNYKEN